MNSLVFAMLVACATAQWVYPNAHWSAPYYGRWWGPTNQYHAQDAFGQASYGYSYPGAAATNFRDAAGNQVGSYAYMSPDGKEVKVSYVADHNGFRVLSNNLPVAPVHNVAEGPKPVQDTAEVVAAKAEHAAAHAKALSGDRQKRQVFYPYAYNAAPVVHTPVVAAPVVAKTTVNSLVLEKDLEAKTPAATNMLNEKVVSHDVYTPIAHHVAPAYSWSYPSVYPAWAGIPAKFEESKDESIKVESARKKRATVIVPSSQFASDYAYSSVDLNQDGQPDNKQLYYPYAYSYPTYAYGAFPYYY